MSRPDSDPSYRPRTLVPARTLRDPSAHPFAAGGARFVVGIAAAVVAASFPLAAAAVAFACVAVYALVGLVRRRSRRSDGGTTADVPGVVTGTLRVPVGRRDAERLVIAVEVTVARTDGE